jgi:phosphonoacetaldehyde hydrolase
MCFVNMARLDVYPPQGCVKVGDTPADIEEGLNAGMWTVGVTDSGNEVGLTNAQWTALNEAERAAFRRVARERLEDSGAHYVIPCLDRLGSVLDKIETGAK